ncbi:unnamed protein product [Rotaria sordida]|uniref:Fibronectin type-III domain-containing protein n=1 Tax=Rotaria sordida TaxID=392033 RepID=A0A814WR78_9BILA|nr:unnamed protein product [Rotaria sordida]CAF1479862.1 unnamed protein product [Rotaria sordida]
MSIPLSSSSSLSSEIEHKPKRPSNILRFRNRCQQIFTSTRQHSILRRRFRKSTTYDISSDEVLSSENNLESSKSTSMNRIRHGGIRRFSLVKLELPAGDSSTSPTDDSKGQIPSSSPNLIQKLLFRQFSPKTRPCSTALSSDDNVSTSNDTPPNYASGGRHITTPTTPKLSWSNSTSSNNCKQSIDIKENLLLSPPNTNLSKNQQSDLTSYLSRRRNTTGSISINKIVDLKITSSGNTLKLSAPSTFGSNSNNKLSTEKDIFQTVEDSDLFTTKQLLQANENLVNSYNEYDWCPLDIAIMLNNIPMIQLLVEYGGEESTKIQPEECRYQSVCHQLIILSQQNIDETIKKSSSNKLTTDDVQLRRSSPSNDTQQRHRRISKGQQEQLQIQQQQFYQQRTLTLTQMKDNYEQAGIPDAPTNVRLMVTGSNSITVTYDEPHRSNGAMVIKYKIEWCTNENFDENSSSDGIIHSDIVKNCFLREYVIRDLPIGQKCYVRVSAGNIRGFGPPAIANPPYCVPSSWREFSKTSRPNVCDLRFEEILNKIRPEKIIYERGGIGTALSNTYYTNNGTFDGNESPEMSMSVNSMRTRRRSYGNLRRNLRQLFQLYPRLAKTMKRGLYLVSVMLNGEKILVTNEDVLPMVEVDENYGHNLLGDFQWFMKLTFVWDDLKTLRPDFERCSSATTFYLRMKLVQAAIELQTLEEINNLGRLHHTYIRDNDGNIAFILINDLSSNNSSDTRINNCPPNLKWISITKFYETTKETESLTNNSSLQQITDKLPDMIDFYHASMRRLDSGLYVAYLKMQNSVDCVRVMVNKYMPGSLPCTRIRSVANVSREEWEWLHKNSINHNNDETTIENVHDENGLSLFKIQFQEAAKELCLMLNLPETHFSNSRIYDAQVVEIRDDLSLIILMSTADEVNILSTPSTSNQRHSISNDCLTPFMYLPVYIFEVLQHLSNNYRFISQYSRVSICLDFELICAQQSQREAFSINELDESRYRLNHLLSCQQDLDDIWRSSRWLVDVINCAKDKSYAGISLKSWLTFQPSSNIQLKIITTDSSSSNYASDSELHTVKFSNSTLTLPTTITSTSLSASFLNETSLIKNFDSGFIDHDLNNVDRFLISRPSSISTSESNDPIELTFYIPILTSNTLTPFKLRTNKMITLNELLKIILKQQNILLKSISTSSSSSSSSSSYVFMWIRSNGREQILDDNLTAGEIEKRLICHGGQIHLRSKGLSLSRSTQPLNRLSSPRLSPTTQTASNTNTSNNNSNVPGSNLSLNI